MKALIVYGTRGGGTTDVAKKIGEILVNRGNIVTIVDAKEEQPKIAPFDLIVVG